MTDDGSFILRNPSKMPPPAYDAVRAEKIYGEAFLRVMEFVTLNMIEGPVLEFGVLNGYTAHKLAGLMKSCDPCHEGDLWLFDSFQGLPEIEGIDLESPEGVTRRWRAGWPNERIPFIEESIGRVLNHVLGAGRVHIVKGWFKDTVNQIPSIPASIVHLDCDLYESTMTILGEIDKRNLYQQGQIILFDDWNCGKADYKFGQRKALQSFPHRHGKFFEPWFSYGWHGQAFIVHTD